MVTELERDAGLQLSRKEFTTMVKSLSLSGGTRVGVLLLHPAYLQEMASTQSRNTSLLGFAVGVIKVDEMVEIATKSSSVDGLIFQVEDTLSPPGNALFYRSSKLASAPDQYYAWQKKVPMADRTWTLSVFPSAAYLQRQHHWTSLLVGVGGLTLAALLQMLLLMTTGRTSIIQRKVLEQSVELQTKSDAIEDQNAQLNTLFSLSPDGFVAFGPDGSIKFANPAFQTMTGIAQEDIIGKNEVSLEDELRKRCEKPEAFNGLSTYFSDDLTQAQHGLLSLCSPHYAVLRLVGIHSPSSNVARILYLRDITREAEVDEMKSQFLSHAAHELRTPMSSILGFSELLLEIELDAPTQRDLLETIHRQSLWLVDILNELLDLSRIEARGGQDLTIINLDLAELAGETIAAVAVSDERWNITLDLPAQGVQAMADRAKLRQALTNVISNAIKYSPLGGEIRVAIVSTPGRAGIMVSDHGIGMTPAQILHFGDRFWRADTTGKIAGTGLGVAIVKEVLTLMGGSMEISSELNRGTTVTLWLRPGQPPKMA